jgi:4-amino-4-deoxy-L-arabinose transferase-like glycosyltransferase
MIKYTRWKVLFTPQRLAILILVAHLVLGVLYSVVVPIWEAHDEWGHHAFVGYLATRRAFPPPGTKLVERYDESVQPPLYYILGALATFWIKTDDGLEPIINPYATTGDGTGGVNFAVHRWEAESFPYRGTVLSIHVTRLVSVLLSTLVVWTTYLIGRSMFPQREELTLGAMAINAFWPQFLFIGSVVNNDIMVTAFGSLVLFFMLRIVIHETAFRDWLALGFCLAGAFASKRNALSLFPLVLVGLSIPAIRELKKIPAPLRWVLVALLVLSAALAWWLFQNVILRLPYFQAYARTLSWLHVFFYPSTIAEQVKWSSFFDTLQYAFVTFWAVFGWGNIGVETWIYDVAAFVCLLASLGLVISFIREPRPRAKLGLLILIADVCLVVALPMYRSVYRNEIFLMPGRYILPAITAVSVLLSVGLAAPMPVRVARTLIAIVAIVMFVFALIVPFHYILPAYAEPPLLSPADLQAIQNPLRVNFNDKAEVLGYDVGRGRVRAGEAIAITLYWRCLGRMEHNYTLAVQVLGPDYRAYGGLNLYPGRGNFATSLWQVGDAFSETYWIPVAPDAPAPVMGRIKVALFIDGPTQEHLPVLDPQGQIADRSAVFGRIKIVPRERPEHVIENQVYYDLDGKVALIGYELTSPVDRGTGLDLRLYWQALSEMDEDYTVFVHWLDEGGRILTQQDNQPRDGTYPTGLWNEGEVVEDLYHLAVPAGRPPVLLTVGMYRLETLERLAVFDENGQRLADDRIILREEVPLLEPDNVIKIRPLAHNDQLRCVIARSGATKQSPPLIAVEGRRLLRFARNDTSVPLT